MNDEQNQILDWDQSMSVGNELLDNQHRKLLKQISILKFSLMSGDAIDNIKSIVDFLKDYMENHLVDEEKYMLENNYPYFEEHKKVHDWARHKFAEIISRLLDNESDKNKLADDLEKYLRQWWINHIKVEDKKYADYIDNLNKKEELKENE